MSSEKKDKEASFIQVSKKEDTINADRQNLALLMVKWNNNYHSKFQSFARDLEFYVHVTEQHLKLRADEIEPASPLTQPYTPPPPSPKREG